MHELTLTRQMVDHLSSKVEKENLGRVVKVVLEIGKLSGIVVEAIKFSFDICIAGSQLEGAELEVISIPAKGCCKSCGKTEHLRSIVEVCDCGELNWTWICGRDMIIKNIEVV